MTTSSASPLVEAYCAAVASLGPELNNWQQTRVALGYVLVGAIVGADTKAADLQRLSGELRTVLDELQPDVDDDPDSLANALKDLEPRPVRS